MPNDPTEIVTGYEVLWKATVDLPFDDALGSHRGTCRPPRPPATPWTEPGQRHRATPSRSAPPTAPAKSRAIPRHRGQGDAAGAPPLVSPGAPDQPDGHRAGRPLEVSLVLWTLPTNASKLDKRRRCATRPEDGPRDRLGSQWTDLAADGDQRTPGDQPEVNGTGLPLRSARREQRVRHRPGGPRRPERRNWRSPSAPRPGCSANGGDNAEVDPGLGRCRTKGTSEIDAVAGALEGHEWTCRSTTPASQVGRPAVQADATSHTESPALTNGVPATTFQVRATNSAGNGDPATGAATPRAPSRSW